MSAPKIRIVVDIVPGAPKFAWWCEACPDEPPNFGREARTIAAAADAGREHLRRFHYDKEAVVSAALDRWAAETPELDEPRYSRACGVSLAACAATSCGCVPVDVDAEIGPESGVQGFAADVQPAINAAIDRMNDAMNRYATHDNPLQTAHNKGVRR